LPGGAVAANVVRPGERRGNLRESGVESEWIFYGMRDMKGGKGMAD
jgi:hypothetical protein